MTFDGRANGYGIANSCETLQKVDENSEQHPSVLDTLYNDFKLSYSDPYVRKLCFWWAVAMGGYLQVSAA